MAKTSRSGATMSDKAWGFLYRATENWCRTRLRADERCEGCGLCAQLCPVGNVELRHGRPAFGDQCVLCIRCLHACPQEAIQISRFTTDKFRWKGPKGDFRPGRLRPQRRKRARSLAETGPSMTWRLTVGYSGGFRRNLHGASLPCPWLRRWVWTSMSWPIISVSMMHSSPWSRDTRR